MGNETRQENPSQHLWNSRIIGKVLRLKHVVDGEDRPIIHCPALGIHLQMEETPYKSSMRIACSIRKMLCLIFDRRWCGVEAPKVVHVCRGGGFGETLLVVMSPEIFFLWGIFSVTKWMKEQHARDIQVWLHSSFTFSVSELPAHVCAQIEVFFRSSFLLLRWPLCVLHEKGCPGAERLDHLRFTL